MPAPYPERSQIVLDDLWAVAEGDSEGKPVILRFRPGLRDIAGHPEFADRLVIEWDYGDSDVGMPEQEQVDNMDQFEDRIVDAFEPDNQAFLVGVITHAGLREWIFYTSNVDESVNRINAEFSDDEPYPIEIVAVADPEWEEYLGIIDNCEEPEDMDGEEMSDEESLNDEPYEGDTDDGDEGDKYQK